MPPNAIESNSDAGLVPEPQYDLVCIGFGPASLAVAIALHDRGINRRVLFLERQQHFSWHAGMLLPNAKMQISFMKDLATLRDPRSEFTFVNYLKTKDRLVAFTNLSTFLPSREEFNDYFTWCASHFDDCVHYGQETVCVTPRKEGLKPIKSWQVLSKDVISKRETALTAKHVMVAVGGRPNIPPAFPSNLHGSKVIHSSGYSKMVPEILQNPNESYHLAVIGGGQSSAEIFQDLHTRYPHSKIILFTGSSALRPSDDSPL